MPGVWDVEFVDTYVVRCDMRPCNTCRQSGYSGCRMVLPWVQCRTFLRQSPIYYIRRETEMSENRNITPNGKLPFRVTFKLEDLPSVTSLKDGNGIRYK